MKRCKICGWSNSDSVTYCEKCHHEFDSDVFISYSRKDYVDDAGNVRPNNMLSKIKNALKENHISYWFDEDGIYSGDEFASVLTKAIRKSQIFLFVSSVNSNKSKWTSNEISTALEFKKTIIPFRIDNSPYNDSVMMKIVSFDFIECNNTDKAINKLIKAVRHHLSMTEIPPRINLTIPDEAEGATVIYNIGGQIHKQIINRKETYNSETSIYKKETSDFPTTNVALNDTAINSPTQKPAKRKFTFWYVFFTVIAMFLALGALVLCQRQNISHNNNEITISGEKDIETICRPVDLGLPSATMWADKNIGATSIYDYGNLYAWGEIFIKKDYSQGLYNPNDKPKTSISAAANDAAKAVLGEEWAIPTEAQFKELLDKCQWKWVEIAGHNGFEVIGINGNKIFLPAAGWICSSHPDYQNKYGYYWTNERVSSNLQFARSLQFPKNGKGIIGNGYLYYGRSIRAVYHGIAVAE